MCLPYFIYPLTSWKTFEYFSVFFFFLGLHQQHMEVLRIEVESELQLPAHTTATAMPDPSCICDLYRSLWQCWILNPLSEAKDRTRILMDTSWVRYHWATMETPCISFFFFFLLLGPTVTRWWKKRWWNKRGRKKRNNEGMYSKVVSTHSELHRRSGKKKKKKSRPLFFIFHSTLISSLHAKGPFCQWDRSHLLTYSKYCLLQTFQLTHVKKALWKLMNLDNLSKWNYVKIYNILT